MMKSLAKLSIRIVSLVLIVKSLSALINYMTMDLSPIKEIIDVPLKNGIYFSIIPLLLKIGIALLLWVVSDKLAILMIGKDDDVMTWNVNYNQLFSIVLKVLGIIIAIYGLTSLISNAFNIFPYMRYFYNDLFSAQYRDILTSSILIPGIQILTGYILFSKTQSFIK